MQTRLGNSCKGDTTLCSSYFGRRTADKPHHTERGEEGTCTTVQSPACFTTRTASPGSPRRAPHHSARPRPGAGPPLPATAPAEAMAPGRGRRFRAVRGTGAGGTGTGPPSTAESTGGPGPARPSTAESTGAPGAGPGSCRGLRGRGFEPGADVSLRAKTCSLGRSCFLGLPPWQMRGAWLCDNVEMCVPSGLHYPQLWLVCTLGFARRCPGSTCISPVWLDRCNFLSFSLSQVASVVFLELCLTLAAVVPLGGRATHVSTQPLATWKTTQVVLLAPRCSSSALHTTEVGACCQFVAWNMHRDSQQPCLSA